MLSSLGGKLANALTRAGCFSRENPFLFLEIPTYYAYTSGSLR